ncbi:two-component sensor histidine kinase [Microbacterium sp. EYE_5]|uniref:sensor histidine kinase n=1 Tax=unclassified Microbacterium TaxID=2609290 RepID=UPI002006589D|nr:MULTISPECIES: ATP-binding protein [unclassified Microbacterium]MCK6081796.1 two-component sensor histidine kinase [Microbacterium sp. EYE_382]MCK6087066.1 two-component sensor histidine kinase [Microbacterium sp. EYE_384]MCK6124956.1 two-component sensor histidine kinase [Microbacterium sp. EYE_80]MCK6127829.1 two-component sensor histidine kinase [Microbacterium sp. EYE_79]MCK6142750.1 two-component sensor histidine kinase [Microbacterium sp. EYE_39]
MDSTQLALLALAVGLLVGGGAVALVFYALRARELTRRVTSVELPEGTGSVLQAMDDAAVVVDPSMLILAASATAEVFGLRVDESLQADRLRHLARSARQTGLPAAESMHLNRGIEPRVVAARASVITPRLTLIVIRDITERERVEQMRRDFVANTSHELKTPVGAVTLLAEAIESASDDPEQVRHFAGRLSGEATRLGQLTSRIMNLSRLQSADEIAEMRDVSVDEVVRSAIESQTISAESAGIAVARGGDRGLFVRGDPQILTEAVSNLLANAIAYSPAGAQVGVGVRVADGAVEIAVADHGIGIPEADQQRIFERFYRADQARSRRTGGTGLGLSIVKHAVQRHGGSVDLWSRPGRGSTFTIRLPLAAAPEGAVPRKPKKTAKPSKAAGLKSPARKNAP